MGAQARALLLQLALEADERGEEQGEGQLGHLAGPLARSGVEQFGSDGLAGGYERIGEELRYDHLAIVA
ncbi:hypothetical protein GCM10018779_48820 [Streptomyces griseocarneus]|nr:hypothetical protein GCM10018779_48820 [Streptomyces griseocarneus]